ncbi:MAG: polymer-forming cytoskeletal protein [Leptotrichiaceae bacterium]|nr:polymer-forming cytoskeletal protein [Leptotrichiaceae bacterium]
MGIFSNNNGKELNVSEGVSVISAKTYVKGVVETDSMTQIEGVLEGDIKCDNTVHVSSGGRIVGNIVAKTVFVDGEVSGEILAEKVEIGEKGRVLANVVSTLFVIQEGGLFEGNKKMKKAEAFIEYEETESSEV